MTEALAPDLRRLLARFAALGQPRRYDDSGFRLASTLEPPATAHEIAATVPEHAPDELRELWSLTRGARLFEDVDYGQWGMVILSPAASARRTAHERIARPDELRPHDVVIAEFLGDSDLLIASVDGSGGWQLRVAEPLLPREDWPVLQGSLAGVLWRFLASGGEKYW
ncbi:MULTISPECIES: hypothetical protein [unclassified Actinotalea]|uniref:hypothetical protein n=1 Tax=unclassified Actinotalea TaxID=2638618 RepID=UPI0015F4426E|nr:MULTISPECIES: hypothetical protein [unclassified Actinotalea]